MVTEAMVFEKMVIFGPDVKVKLSNICRALGVPSSFRDEKAVQGKPANSNGGAMRVYNHLQNLRTKGLVVCTRPNPVGHYYYELAPDSLEKLLANV